MYEAREMKKIGGLTASLQIAVHAAPSPPPEAHRRGLECGDLDILLRATAVQRLVKSPEDPSLMLRLLARPNLSGLDSELLVLRDCGVKLKLKCPPTMRCSLLLRMTADSPVSKH